MGDDRRHFFFGERKEICKTNNFSFCFFCRVACVIYNFVIYDLLTRYLAE